MQRAAYTTFFLSHFSIYTRKLDFRNLKYHYLWNKEHRRVTYGSGLWSHFLLVSELHTYSSVVTETLLLPLGVDI